MTTYSISVRLRRTMHHSLHVAVPVTEDLMTRDADGNARLDADKVFAQAIALATVEHHVWAVDGEPALEVHPVQTPPPVKP
jgi:hypothetical protein